ncbi:MAG: hypothetical protein QXG10_04610 [Candidatus Hadarchaeales archaeon]
MENKKAPMWALGILLVAILLLVGALVAIFLSASGGLALEYGVILLVLGWVFIAVFFAVARKYAKPVAKAEPQKSE